MPYLAIDLFSSSSTLLPRLRALRQVLRFFGKQNRKKKAHAPFFNDFIFQKIVKFLIGPLKGAAPLNGVIGYLE